MADVKTYDPNSIIQSFGTIPILGLDDDMVEIEFDEDEFTDKAGSQGDVVVTRNRNRLADITLHLLAESPTNDRLSAHADLSRVSPIFYQPYQLKNLLGTTLLFAKKAWIKKRPAVEYAKESGSRVWVLRGVFDQYTVGGSVA